MPIEPKCLERLKAITVRLLAQEDPNNGELAKLVQHAIEFTSPDVAEHSKNLKAIEEHVRLGFIEIIKRQNSGDIVEWLAQMMTDVAVTTSIAPHIAQCKIINRIIAESNGKKPAKEGEEWKQQ